MTLTVTDLTVMDGPRTPVAGVSLTVEPGQVTAVIGTHTHIPTADAHVLPGGTAYMSDAGMTGDYDSIIGVEKEIAIHRFISKMPGERMRPAGNKGTLCGALVITDNKNGKAKSIEPIRLGSVLSETRPAAL